MHVSSNIQKKQPHMRISSAQIYLCYIQLYIISLYIYSIVQQRYRLMLHSHDCTVVELGHSGNGFRGTGGGQRQQQCQQHGLKHGVRYLWLGL